MPLCDQINLIGQIADAMFDIAPLVRDAMSTHADFQQIGKRMLLAWRQGIGGLYDRRVYSLPVSRLSTAFDAISDPAPVKPERVVVGRSDLLQRRKSCA